MHKTSLLILCLICCLASTGCISYGITYTYLHSRPNDKKRTYLITSEPEGADVYTHWLGMEIHRGKTPIELTLDPTDGWTTPADLCGEGYYCQTMVLKKEGYYDREVTVAYGTNYSKNVGIGLLFDTTFILPAILDIPLLPIVYLVSFITPTRGRRFDYSFYPDIVLFKKEDSQEATSLPQNNAPQSSD